MKFKAPSFLKKITNLFQEKPFSLQQLTQLKALLKDHKEVEYVFIKQDPSHVLLFYKKGKNKAPVCIFYGNKMIEYPPNRELNFTPEETISLDKLLGKIEEKLL